MKKSSIRKKNNFIRHLLAIAAAAAMFCCSFYPLTTDAADKSTADTETVTETASISKGGTLEADGADGCTVTVSYDAKAGIPEGTVLKAEEIREGTSEYDRYYKETADKLEKESPDARISGAHFYDITIQDENGNAIEPESSVSVRISYDTPMQAEADEDGCQIIHFAEDSGKETPEMAENVKADDAANLSSVAFKADSFSVYGVLQTQQTESDSESESETDTADTETSAAVTYAAQGAAAAASLTDSDDSNGPAVSKTLTDNGDGTYNINLSVTGRTEVETETSKYNVVVVQDLSGSMNRTSGSTTRIQAAKDALKELGTAFQSVNSSSPDTVAVSLVTFATTATADGVVYTQFGSGSAYETKVDSLSAADENDAQNSSTNWEDALVKANSVSFGADRSSYPTYVIFISDGDPTVRNSKNGRYEDMPLSFPVEPGVTNYWDYIITNYPDYTNQPTLTDTRFEHTSGVYGNGLGETDCTITRKKNLSQVIYEKTFEDLNYHAGAVTAQELVSGGKTLYAIGTFNNTDKMQELVTFTGESAADYYYDAADADTLSSTLKAIAAKITKNFSYKNVTLHDSLTALTAADIRDGIDSGEVTYTKTDSSGSSTTWDDAPAATIDSDGNFTWSLGENFELENGVTYTASFRVWPNQTAYDQTADLLGGRKDYSNVSAAHPEIVQASDGTYMLKTNKDNTDSSNPDHVYVTYTSVDKTTPGSEIDTPGTKAIDNPDPVPLQDTELTIEKVWSGADDEDLQNITSITVNVMQGEEVYQTITLEKDTEGNWKGSVHVSLGLTDKNNADLDTGYDYTMQEITINYSDGSSKSVGDAGFEWTSGTVHPMLDKWTEAGDDASKHPIDYRGTNAQTVTVTNTKTAPPTTQITLQKVKASDNGDNSVLLGGVEFNLYKADENWQQVGDAIAQPTSDESGLLTLTDLESGNYLLYETKAKDGYYLPTEPWKITVSDDLSVTVTDQDGKTVSVSDEGYYLITNNETYELPNAGGIGRTPIETAGLALMMTALAGYIFYLRKRRERRSQL